MSDTVLVNLRKFTKASLANSPTFQALVQVIPPVGIGDPTEEAQANGHIYHVSPPMTADGKPYAIEQLQALWPFAILDREDIDLTIEAAGGGDGDQFSAPGVVTVQIDAPVPEDIQADEQAIADFIENIAWGIAVDFNAQRKEAGRLAYDNCKITQSMRPHPSKFKDVGNIVRIHLMFTAPMWI